MKKQWSVSGIVIDELSTTEIAIMNSYLVSDSRASSNAMAVLALNNQLSYDEPVYLPNMTKSLQLSVAQEIDQVEEYMLVYPNPAVDFSSVRYAYLEPYNVLNITVVDINGKIIFSKSLMSSEDEIILPIAKFSKGNYIVNLLADGRVVYSDKLIKK